MLDTDDIDFTILAWPVTGWRGLILLLVIVGALVVIVVGNERDCAARTCATGHGALVDGECLCVERPIP